MMWMSLIRYCQDSKLFMSTNRVCHITWSFCRFPSSLTEVRWTISTCSIRILFISGPENHLANSPSDTVHCILIGGWNQEADRWHGRLAAFIIQHPPLEGLRVAQQSTFVSSVHRDLRRRNMLTSDHCTKCTAGSSSFSEK